MLRSGERAAIELPAGVTQESVMKTLELGHGYNWTILVSNPVLMAYGSTKVGNLPEILLIGEQNLLLSGGDDVYVDRIQSVLEMLSRQGFRSLSMKGGKAIG